MNKIDGKTTKKIEDVETILHVFRKFARAKVPLPTHLQGLLNDILGSDVELCAFYHLRSLRYPSIRRMLRINTAKSLGMSDRDDDDEESDTEDFHPVKNIKIKKVTDERMYR